MKIQNIALTKNITKLSFGNQKQTIAKQSSTPNYNFSYSDKYTIKDKNSYYGNIVEDLKAYIKSKNGKIKESDILAPIGHGALTIVYDIGNNKVLKCSLENPLEYREHNPNVDIPFLSPVEKFGEHYFVIEPKADTQNITQQDCINVIERIYKEGFEPSNDLNFYTTRQIGKIDNKAYLLDTRAALPAPDKYSQFIYNYCEQNKHIFRSHFKKENLTQAQNTRDILHIDETPRNNLTFAEGYKMARQVIKDNVKYNYMGPFEGFLNILAVLHVGIKCKAKDIRKVCRVQFFAPK